MFSKFFETLFKSNVNKQWIRESTLHDDDDDGDDDHNGKIQLQTIPVQERKKGQR